ncbi:TIR domain-containing protein [Methanobrevibacter sp.]
MTHDVFISYSTKNTEHAEAIYEKLEGNGIKCWFAPKNIGTATNFAEEIMLGIKPAKVVVLVFSKYAQESEYVKKEIDAAFREKKKIVPIKVDESFPKDQMEFYLANTQWLDASESARKKEGETLEQCYDKLLSVVQNLVETFREDDKGGIVPPPPFEIPKTEKSFFEKHKMPIIALAVVLIAVIGFVAYAGIGSENSTDVKNETGIDIGYIGLEDNGDGSYSYYVFGTISEGFSNSSNDVVHIDFYDKESKVVDTSDTKIGDVDGNILGSIDVSKKNVDKISLELQDKNNKVLYDVESNNIIEQ